MRKSILYKAWKDSIHDDFYYKEKKEEHETKNRGKINEYSGQEVQNAWEKNSFVLYIQADKMEAKRTVFLLARFLSNKE
jgi:hypothetical protein